MSARAVWPRKEKPADLSGSGGFSLQARLEGKRARSARLVVGGDCTPPASLPQSPILHWCCGAAAWREEEAQP